MLAGAAARPSWTATKPPKQLAEGSHPLSLCLCTKGPFSPSAIRHAKRPSCVCVCVCVCVFVQAGVDLGQVRDEELRLEEIRQGKSKKQAGKVKNRRMPVSEVRQCLLSPL